jgi:predicted Zn-ribbon and HTH transcriptional regulator
MEYQASCADLNQTFERMRCGATTPLLALPAHCSKCGYGGGVIHSPPRAPQWKTA